MNRTPSLLLAVIAALMAGCATLPPPQDRVESTAITDTASTRLGRAVVPYVAPHPGKSGIHKFPDPHDAFAARVRMAAAAERTLDAQYFIWNGDQVGYLLFEELWKAAERGVRVRLLLDDANTAGLDPTLAALDAHPGIEIRLYNPFSHRGSRALGYLTDFTRLNHRMHNKSFTADNQLSVVGGRNIANEYFGAGSGIGFADIDVLVVGPAVRDISKQFDVYWNSASAYPAAGFVGAPGPDAAAWLQQKFAATHADPVTVEYLAAVERAPLLAELREGRLSFAWSTPRVVYDDPAKTLEAERAELLLFTQLVESMGRPEKRFDLVSPYFVPGTGGTARLVDLARRGVKVRILTNALSASDETVVHAGYLKHRVELLRAGIALWELKPTVATLAVETRHRFGSGGSAGLHAKTFAVDDARIFVGSFNFDQRSAHLNTEMGIVIDSPAIASQLGDFFDKTVPQMAYEVRLAPDGEKLVWVERIPGGAEKRYDNDPETDGWTRFKVQFMSILPIDWLL
jgi:putative cardiolipin synthase